MDHRLHAFKTEVLQYTDILSEDDWHFFQLQLKPVSYLKGEEVFSRTEVCKMVLFISEGLLASEFHTEEEYIINRFFKPNDLCANLVSLLTEQLANDRLFAVTNVAGVLIPYQLMMENYLHSTSIGIYFRKKVLETMLADKHFMSVKTISGVEPKLTFLQENYPEVILHTPWKYIASFMGVTPSWLSRKLKQQKG